MILAAATTAYSVLVNRILDMKLYIRRAVQYALARYTLIVAATLPFLIFVFYVYLNRGKTVSGLLTDFHLILPLVAALSILCLPLRSKANHLIDRHFFREQYDSKQILADFIQSTRETSNPMEMALLLTNEINRALHLDTISILYSLEGFRDLRCPGGTVSPLDLSWPLAALLAGSHDPLDVDLKSHAGTLQRLSAEEREWLVDGNFSVLVPLLASDKSLIGLIGLGEKKSELPFSSEDRVLLAAIASAVALTIENRVLHATPILKEAQETRTGLPVAQKSWMSDSFSTAAAECTRCYKLQAKNLPSCVDCGGSVAAAHVPLILHGKFRFERRVALGGMGVVYEATDMDLQRKVAIKTLPRTSPELCSRLRREARAAAAVSHPNLASIFGAEMWQGTPMLILEYLEGGTLAQRLKKEKLELGEGLRLGILMCDVLDRMHYAGILHRDIKPSNIGYTADMMPKLLDLGLAKIAGRAEDVQNTDQGIRDISDQSTLSFSRSQTLEGSILGTMAYLSPEALRAEPPVPRFDLWSLSVVLFESLLGVNPFLGNTLLETADRIRNVNPMILQKFAQGIPDVVASLFTDLLAIGPDRRPKTAVELSRRLKQTLQSVRRLKCTDKTAGATA